jgi:Ca2+-binding EF-hand superfamily protein
LLAEALGACSAETSPALGPLPPTLDLNHNGSISSDELAAFIMGPDMFSRIDIDKSGVIDPDEWKRFDTTRQSQQDFDALDANHDKQITSEEWTQNVGTSGVTMHLFSHLDTNQDQALSREELRQGPLASMLSLTW